MKEIRDIVQSYHRARRLGMACVLATVVQVEGSSYRRPGARMLVTEDGCMTGAISGGCLEGDALRKAMLALVERRSRLVTYDTTDEEDTMGIQLGCNGIVHILFEPVLEEDAQNPVALLEQWLERRDAGVVITLFSLEVRAQSGGTIACRTADDLLVSDDSGCLKGLEVPIQQAFAERRTVMVQVEHEGPEHSALIAYLAPPVILNVFGAGNDVQPLTAMAGLMGWEVSVVDGRRTHATATRFPGVQHVGVAPAAQALQGLSIDARSIGLLMTHNFNYDLEVLAQLLETDCPFIGILGPKAKLAKLIAALEDGGRQVSAADMQRIHSPVGLDIGAETAQEIALSIVAEVQAFLTGGDGRALVSKETPIHERVVVA